MDERIHFAVQAIGAGRDDEFMGRPHRVFPAVLVKSQVLQNNLGRTFLPADAITPAWAAIANMAPVLTLHPEKRGQPVSGRDRAILNANGAGFLLNVRAEGDELRGDVFIDAARAEAIADLRVILAKLEKGEPAELSTGFPVAIEETKGAHNGRDYDRVIRPIGFDHLAIFATATGACSLKDGCGLGVNHAGDCEDADAENAAGATADPQPGLIRKVADQVLAYLRKHSDNAVTTPEAGDDSTEGNAMNRDQMIAHLAANGACKDDLAKLSDASVKAWYEAANKAAPEPEPKGDGWDKAREWHAKYKEAVQEFTPAKVALERKRVDMLEALLLSVQRLPYEDDELKAMNVDDLGKVYKMAFPDRPNYAPRGGPRDSTTNMSIHFKPLAILGDGPSVFDKEAN
jgi:hypothetical protein